MRLSRIAAAGALVLGLYVAPCWAEEKPDVSRLKEEFERIQYGNDYYDKYREVHYWGKVHLSIRDYHYRTGDAVALGLATKSKTWLGFKDIFPAQEIQEHFMKEFRRLFGDLPFHDVDEGRRERFNKFFKQYGKEKNFAEMLEAEEIAYRRSRYEGRPGAIYCSIRVKRRTFPVLYETNCRISAREDLAGYASSVEFTDIGFSSPDYIVGEIKRVLSNMLVKLSQKIDKIRKSGRRR